MGIATTMAIIGVATVASNAYQAKKGGDAAKQAGAQQAAAADAANRQQQQIYEDQRAMQSPYVGAGQSAATTLGRLTGAPEGSQFAAPPQQMSGAQSAPPGTAVPRQQTLGSLGGYDPSGQAPTGPAGGPPEAPQLRPMPGPLAMPGAMPGGPPAPPQAPPMGGMPGQMVMLQAPDGSTRQVPASAAQALIARGAKQVG